MASLSKDLKKLVDKITKGRRDWTPEELQLQQNYPEEVERLLKARLGVKE